MATSAGPISAAPPAISAPVAAPAVSSPAAPVSAPVSAPVAPAAPVAPVAPVADPAKPGEPAAPAGPPKNTDFPDTEEGSNQFLAKLGEWEAAHPEGEKKPDAAPEAPKPAEEVDPEKSADLPADKAPIATPAKLAEMLDKADAVKAAFEAHPEVKEQVFEAFRQLAEYEPIVQMFPTKGDAEFAQRNTQELLGLKTASMRLARNPDSAPQFLDAFDSAYLHVDEKGNPVKDAQGNPVYGDDYKPAIHALVQREIGGYQKQFATEMEQLKGKLATGVYPNEAAKEADQQRLDNLQTAADAIEILEMVRSGDLFKAALPELPADATPAAKAWFEQEKAELAERERALDEKTQGADKQTRTQTAQKFDTEVRIAAGTHAGSVITQIMKQKEEAGMYIPEFYKQQKWIDNDPKSPTYGQESQTPAIYMKLWNAYQRETSLGPDGKPYPETDMRAVNEKVRHELLPPNAQTKALREEWEKTQIGKRMPRLIDAEVKWIQSQVKVDVDKQGQRSAARAQAAQAEPRSAGSSLPQGATDEEILKQITAEFNKNPDARGWDEMETEARRATRFRQIRAGAK